MNINKFVLFCFAFLVICFGNLYAQTDNRLNGSWLSKFDDFVLEYRFNDGNWETLLNGMQNEKGTYTVNDGKITRTSTHVHGDCVSSLFGEYFKLDSKWHTINEFIIEFRRQFTALGLSEKDINNLTNQLVTPNEIIPYSVDKNTLILSFDGEVMIFNKK